MEDCWSDKLYYPLKTKLSQKQRVALKHRREGTRVGGCADADIAAAALCPGLVCARIRHAVQQ